MVFGATGTRGGGLAHTILNDLQSEFSVRVVTRDIHSANAKELAGRGAEVVAGDIDDPGSMKKALAGAYGAFLSRFSWPITRRKRNHGSEKYGRNRESSRIKTGYLVIAGRYKKIYSPQ